MMTVPFLSRLVKRRVPDVGLRCSLLSVSYLSRRAIVWQLGVPVTVFFLSSIMTGCSSSTSTRETPERRFGVVQEEDEFKFITKIRAEKAREDDRKVNVGALNRTSSRRYIELLPPGFNRDQFLLEVVSYLGVQYAYGGNSKNGLDCSGYTCEVFRNAANTLLPRSTTEQFGVGNDVQQEELQFGDLVFFNTTGQAPSHVGIYLEDGIFAHASVVEGVTLSSLESTYYRKRFVGARRVW
jgi:cell wall-associated NlpC family hydrolase